MTAFERAGKGSKSAQDWSAKVKQIVDDKRRILEAQDWQDIILLEHGERIVILMLDSLQDDNRFMRLSGRWSLRNLAQGFTPEQIEQIAWHLLVATAPPTIADLLVPLSLPQNDPILFGLYLALRAHPELFQMLNPGPEPAWQLV